MLNWVHVDTTYMDYLRTHGDSRIPFTNYGAEKIKPFFGVLFTVGEIYYVTQVSHPQPRHYGQKNSLIFQKVFDPKVSNHLIAVVNLNYMFPIHKSLVTPLSNSTIRSTMVSATPTQINNYISLMRKEIQAINTMDLEKKAVKLYKYKYQYPSDYMSKLCLDYKALELVCVQYMRQQQANTSFQI